MAEVFKFTKSTIEAYDILVPFTNDNPDITYTVDNVVSVSATKRSDGTDATADVIDDAQTTQSSNKAIIWVQEGEDGEVYDITVLAEMTTGQLIAQYIEMNVQDPRD